MNLETVLQGLAITIVGMSLVFLALGLIVLAMVLMGRYLNPTSRPKQDTLVVGSESEERARVAAIAAAIVLITDRDQSRSPGTWNPSALADTTSVWQAAHRTRTLARNQ